MHIVLFSKTLLTLYADAILNEYLDIKRRILPVCLRFIGPELRPCSDTSVAHFAETNPPIRFLFQRYTVFHK